MSQKVQELLNRAMELSAGERIELSDLLIRTLDSPGEDVTEEEWAASWGPELQRRSESLERGESQARDWRESLQLARDSLKKD